MAIRLKDIAKRAGVSVGTASSILSSDRSKNYSEKTRQAVSVAARELNYRPNAMARALATQRTGYVGFVLSDAIMGGWQNAYYSRYLTGVEHACRRRGYGLHISLYNLSNLDTFVFPEHIGQRSVDGVILTGYVETEVVRQFHELDIPTLSLGQDVEEAGLVPTISSDDVSGWIEAIRYAASLGHRKIVMLGSPLRRGKDVSRMVIEHLQQQPETSHCRIEIAECANGRCDYTAGDAFYETWIAQPRANRATMVMGSDQSMVAFARGLRKHGLAYPDDVSLISNGDTTLCEFANPPLTAIHYGLEEMGEVAVNMLIDHLEINTPLTTDMSRNDFPCRLTIRESCVAPKSV